MYIALVVLHVLMCLGLIGIVLLQSGKGAVDLWLRKKFGGVCRCH